MTHEERDDAMTRLAILEDELVEMKHRLEDELVEMKHRLLELEAASARTVRQGQT